MPPRRSSRHSASSAQNSTKGISSSGSKPKNTSPLEQSQIQYPISSYFDAISEENLLTCQNEEEESSQEELTSHSSKNMESGNIKEGGVDGALGNIQQSIADVTKTVLELSQSTAKNHKELTDSLSNIVKEQKELKESCELAHKTIGEVKKNNEKIASDLTRLDKTVHVLERENQELRAELDNMDAYSRRENMIIDNIPEGGVGENCTELVYKMLEDDMKVPEARVIKFSAVYRLGKRQPGKERPRPIIAKFHFRPDKESVMKYRTNLKNSNIYIKDDLPMQWETSRRQMNRIFKEAKSQGLAPRWSKDKLVISGVHYAVDTVHSLKMKNSTPHTISTESSDDYTFFSGRFSVFSNFHPSEIEIDGITFNCNEQHYQYSKAKAAKDKAKMSEILAAKDPVLQKRLGGKVSIPTDEWEDGPARAAMKRGLEVKFNTHEYMKELLVGTAGTELVECNQYDKVWAIGLAITDKKRKDSTKWNGDNALGHCLVSIREALLGD
jgi:hypothetical protein